MPDALKTLKFNLITWKVEQLQKWEVYFVGQEWTRREKVANGRIHDYINCLIEELHTY